MDYCFNRDEPRAKERKDEILGCFRLLESGERRRETTIATRGLQKLKDILRDGKGHRGSSEADQVKNLSLPRNQLASHEAIGYPAPNTNLASPDSNDVYSGNGAGQTNPEPQYQWMDFDYSSLDDISFDVDLDVAQFDVLFQNIEGNKLF